MNRSLVGNIMSELRKLANNPAFPNSPIFITYVISMRDSLTAIANDVAQEDPLLAQKLNDVKSRLFFATPTGQTYVNPIVLGEALFSLEYLEAKVQRDESLIWASIHPSIQQSSRKLYEDGHYANAAEDAFIEFNSRAKDLYQRLLPSTTSVPDGSDLMHKLFGTNPALCEVADTSTKSGSDYQQGFHFLATGAMLALRNPKAHSNSESLSAEEAMRRLMFASMLMYKLDEITLDN